MMALSGIAILSADDNAETVDALTSLLAYEGATVRTATCASEVLQVLQTWTPDVLLLDIGMPDMGGYKLLAHIRHEPAHRAIPAVAVTGYAYEEDKDHSAVAGFAGHLTKPFDVTTLFDLIRAVAPNAASGVKAHRGDRGRAPSVLAEASPHPPPEA